MMYFIFGGDPDGNIVVLCDNNDTDFPLKWDRFDGVEPPDGAWCWKDRALAQANLDSLEAQWRAGTESVIECRCVLGWDENVMVAWNDERTGLAAYEVESVQQIKTVPEL